MSTELPYELLEAIFEYLPDEERVKWVRLGKLPYSIFKKVGLRKINITHENQKDVLKSIERGLKISNTSITVHSHAEDDLIERLVGVHTIDLRGRQWLTDRSLKALSGVRNINISGGSQYTDEGFKALCTYYRPKLLH